MCTHIFYFASFVLSFPRLAFAFSPPPLPLYPLSVFCFVLFVSVVLCPLFSTGQTSAAPAAILRPTHDLLWLCQFLFQCFASLPVFVYFLCSGHHRSSPTSAVLIPRLFSVGIFFFVKLSCFLPLVFCSEHDMWLVWDGGLDVGSELR